MKMVILMRVHSNFILEKSQDFQKFLEDVKDFAYAESFKEEWERTSDKPNPFELLDIFPEAKPYLEDKLERWSKYLPSLENLVERQLEWASKRKYSWFWQGIIAITDGSLLEKVEKEIWKLKFLLKIIKPTYKQYDIERIKETVNLKDLVESYGIKLRKTGRSWQGKCPFHNEKHGSFTVFLDGGFKCFGCGAKGDIFTFLELTEGLTFREALEKLG